MMRLNTLTASGTIILIFLALFLYLRKDVQEYEHFKLKTETIDRQKTFAKWVTQSLLLFTLFSITCLIMFNRFDNIYNFPTEFISLRATITQHFLSSDGNILPLDKVLGGAILVGTLMGTVLGTLLTSRNSVDDQPQPTANGDFEALIPRNKIERRWATLISINAGVGEELFFRLVLPLLLFYITGNGIAAFLIAALIFGITHLYQGVMGIFATSILGLVFTALYIWSGSLWLPIILHIIIDVNALVLRSILMERKEKL